MVLGHGLGTGTVTGGKKSRQGAAEHLLETERCDGICAGGATSGDEASQEAGEEQHERDSCDRQGIGRLNLEQQAANRSAEKESDSDAGGQAKNDRRHPLANDQPKQSGGLRTERHADAHFVSAAGHRIRNNTVNTKGGYQERGTGKGDH